MTRIFDKEVERWAGLYKDEPATARYAFFQASAARRTRRRTETCLSLLETRPGDVAFDVGCGTGILARPLAELGVHWVGIDISLPMLRRAEEQFAALAGDYPHALINASAKALPLQPAAADKMLCIGMLNFFPRADLPGLLHNLAAPLRAGGQLIFTSLRLDVLTWLRSRVYPRIPPPFSCPGPLYPHSPATLEALLPAAGLRVERRVDARKYLGLPHYTMYRAVKT